MGSLWIQRITSLMVNVNLMVMVKVDKDIHIMVIGKDQPHDDDYIALQIHHILTILFLHNDPHQQL